MLDLVQRVMTDESGASAAEYAILIALIAVVLIAGVGFFGATLNVFFQNLPGKLGFT